LTNTTTQTSESIPVTGTGKYTLVSMNDANCSGTVSGEAVISILSVAVGFDLNSEYCAGDAIQLIPTFQQGTVSSYEFTSNGKGNIVKQDGVVYYAPAADEKGEIAFTLKGKDICGSDFQSTTKKTIVKGKVKAEITVSTLEIEMGASVSFKVENANATSQYWTINKGLASEEKEFEQSFANPGKYEVILTVFENSCPGADTVLINVKPKKPEVYVPNIFSLSADKEDNKVVKVYGESVSNDGFKFRIYNKWGNLLFETNDFLFANTSGWNGKAPGTGQNQPLGVYTYTLDGQFTTGEKFHKTGTVTLAK
jgi:hypothetical protein